MNIPILIICYNNYKYVNNTLLQIKRINTNYYNNIQIINNTSDDIETIEFLKNVDVKVIKISNNGPWISASKNTEIYNSLPDKFILTDPDLKFNKNIPTDFIEILSNLSDKYQSSKIGLALDISDDEKMYQDTNYLHFNTIFNSEKPFWKNKIQDSDYELYNAPIDTTFCLINKKNINKKSIRVAGNFTAKHLPWYVDNEIYNVYENYTAAKKTTKISTISNVIRSYVETNYSKINKNDELFLIKNNPENSNLNFWINIYKNWEKETFKVFDEHLTKEKIFIDIGAWIGTTAMYGSRKSKYVYCVEADNYSFNDLKENMGNNCIQNYTLINKVIYNIDKTKIQFGKNQFLVNSKMNDSTSQISKNSKVNEGFLMETITLNSIINDYNIDIKDIGLIKVDIEGGEENILDELLDLGNKHKHIKLYISFHFTWWNDKNLDRFKLLTSVQKETIKKNPFCSILF
jgi:FkbM family methyltransferase